MNNKNGHEIKYELKRAMTRKLLGFTAPDKELNVELQRLMSHWKHISRCGLEAVKVWTSECSRVSACGEVPPVSRGSPWEVCAPVGR